jgi:hypothetical protein
LMPAEVRRSFMPPLGVRWASSCSWRGPVWPTPSVIDWTLLSPRGQAILRTIAIPLSQGWTKTEIASGLGTSKRWVSYRMGELRHEIERLG